LQSCRPRPRKMFRRQKKGELANGGSNGHLSNSPAPSPKRGRSPVPTTTPPPPYAESQQQQQQHQQQQQQQKPQEQQQQKQVEEPERPKLTFHCQQAHGSPTGIIAGFTNVKELYAKIAGCYDLDPKEILFCTLNTHKIDMKMLLGGQIGLDDFIFAHVKGQKKELEVEKTEDALGLTITDNGAGYAFIKRIKEGSVVSRHNHIKVGDHIEKLDGRNLVGCRHFEVAKALKEIPRGKRFILRVIEPLKSGFSNIAPAGKKTGSTNMKNGMQTLRIRNNEPVVVEEVNDSKVRATEKINELLENFMGINDSDLASQIYELGEDKENTMDFAEAIDSSDLEEFGFTDSFIFELWGAITDAKSGRL